MFFKRKKSEQTPESTDNSSVSEAPVAPSIQEPEQGQATVGIFARIKKGLSRTSSHFTEGMGNLILGAKVVDDDLIDEIETQLLVADVGMEAADEIIDALTEGVTRKQLSSL